MRCSLRLYFLLHSMFSKNFTCDNDHQHESVLDQHEEPDNIPERIIRTDWVTEDAIYGWRGPTTTAPAPINPRLTGTHRKRNSTR